MTDFNMIQAAIQQRINNKPFAGEEDNRRSIDRLGIRFTEGNLFNVSGNTTGSTVTKEGNGIKVSLDLKWHYVRKTFRYLGNTIVEDRNDTGTYVFELAMDPIFGLRFSREIGKKAFDPNHDSARMAFKELLSDVIVGVFPPKA